MTPQFSSYPSKQKTENNYISICKRSEVYLRQSSQHLHKYSQKLWDPLYRGENGGRGLCPGWRILIYCGRSYITLPACGLKQPTNYAQLFLQLAERRTRNFQTFSYSKALLLAQRKSAQKCGMRNESRCHTFFKFKCNFQLK